MKYTVELTQEEVDFLSYASGFMAGLGENVTGGPLFRLGEIGRKLFSLRNHVLDQIAPENDPQP